MNKWEEKTPPVLPIWRRWCGRWAAAAARLAEICPTCSSSRGLSLAAYGLERKFSRRVVRSGCPAYGQ